ncbi:MAG: serine acetyltransferase [Prevotellaceae bacterium]|jgi:serine O-acetyltransferase|nr:serine acetyltransferase [Prevotellaceae bacterium]
MNVLDTVRKNIAVLTENSISEYKYILRHEKALPSLVKLQEIVNLLREIIFPGYYGDTVIDSNTLEFYLGVKMERLYGLLSEQIMNGLRFDKTDKARAAKENSKQIALQFMDKIPELKRLISTDIKETYDSDPAAKSFEEVIFCYPTIRATFNHRIAHELFKLNVPVIPRAISELAHSETGIDIHPGAQIGEYFSIDHGTGVVVGETTVIGNHVRLYQGVTLGAKRFAMDKDGNILSIPRHPILEDNVVVYANTSILGRITIGRDSIVGGNIWLTNSIPAGSRILQQKAVIIPFEDGGGI